MRSVATSLMGPNSKVTVLAHRDISLRGSLTVLINAAQFESAERICRYLVTNRDAGPLRQIF